MSYREKLLDPRWQKRRLEILGRDNFTCQDCFDTKKTLHVHHLDYEKDCEPWDYPDSYLLTLCADCHKEAEDRKQESEKIILKGIRLALRDTFITHCATQVFSGFNDLNRLIFLLWELDSWRVLELLEAEFLETQKRALTQYSNNAKEHSEICLACGGKTEYFEKYNSSKCCVCSFITPYFIEQPQSELSGK